VTKSEKINKKVTNLKVIWWGKKPEGKRWLASPRHRWE
jgi:hypothetical protein